MTELIMTVFFMAFVVILTCAAAMMVLLLFHQVVDEWDDITDGVRTIWKRKKNP
jgi:hypothetical protein